MLDIYYQQTTLTKDLSTGKIKDESYRIKAKRCEYEDFKMNDDKEKKFLDRQKGFYTICPDLKSTDKPTLILQGDEASLFN